MLVNQRTLWPFLQQCDAVAASGTQAARLKYGTTVVADGSLARHVLTTQRHDYFKQSGFLRIGPTLLEDETRRAVLQRLSVVLRTWQPPSEFDTGRELALLGGSTSGGLRHQGWGARFIRQYFRDIFAGDRNPCFQTLVDRYVDESIVPDDIRGRRFRRYNVVDPIRNELAELFSANQGHNNVPVDLVDVVDIGLTPSATAELYQRLVLSFIGFTGVTLEWVLFLAATHGAPKPTYDAMRAHVNECLRLYPTAWRSVRVARRASIVGPIDIAENDPVLIAINAIHRNPLVWPHADAFDVSRWVNLSPEQRIAFMPFGRGHEMCPASAFAMEALTACGDQIFSQYRPAATRHARRRPRALTLLAPPSGRTKLLLRT